GRLRMLPSLLSAPTQEFLRLRERTRLTDVNRSIHARRLQTAGLLAIDKSFRSGKPVTTFTLTSERRRALESHVRDLLAALNITPAEQKISLASKPDDDWVD